MFQRIIQSPVLVRVVPFAVFLALTCLQDSFSPEARYWIYLLKTIIGAAALAIVWRHIKELAWCFSWPAILVGVGVFALWVGLDELLMRCGLPNSYPKLKTSGEPWNPNVAFGSGSGLAWLFVVTRIVGSTLVVPPLEEVFYRSFVYRYLASKDFLSIPLNRFLPLPFFITSAAFAITHNEWLAAFLCGFAYQGLVLWKNRLGDAVTAHGITNLLLGLWVVWRGAWQYW
jgi:uncharacterized protein